MRPDTVSFCDAVTMWVEKGRAAGVLYLGFFKSFDVVPHSISGAQLESCGLMVWADLGWLSGAHQTTLSLPSLTGHREKIQQKVNGSG